MTNTPTQSTDILILGAGIGGFQTYRTLAKLLRKNGIHKKITLLDQNNFFTFVPMLHEVLSGSIEPSHCTIPLRHIVKAPHEFIRATVTQIHPDKNIVETSQGAIHYHFLVNALGSGVNYFNTTGALEHSFNVRSLSAVLTLRHRLMRLLEGSQPNVRVAIIGGGYTGVEVAGQMAEFAHRYLARNYPDKKISVALVESAPKILAALQMPVRERVTERLNKIGVSIMAGRRVLEVTPTEVKILDNPDLPSDLTIWTAGIRNVAPDTLSESLTDKGRLPVNENLRVNNFSNFYAVGDIALYLNPVTKLPPPQLGETAHRQGDYVAEHIVATLKNQTLKPFKFHSFGQLMPIGDWWAVATFGNFHLYGRLAWWIRRTVYVMFMPGLHYKLKIILDWTLHIFGVRDILSVEREKID